MGYVSLPEGSVDGDLDLPFLKVNFSIMGIG